MDIKEMHYDFKVKINKNDSNQYRNFIIPEIDWLLNLAAEQFVKFIIEPRIPNHYMGFEIRQRSIDDIRKIVKRDILTPSPSIDADRDFIELPDDYWHYINGNVIIKNSKCDNIDAVLKIRQHDDVFNTNSSLYKSSLFWRKVNGVFEGNKIYLYKGDFLIDEVRLTYIKHMKYMHNAEDYANTYYEKLDGVVLTGKQDCELSKETHSEIVDIAVMIATGNIQIPDYKNKIEKLRQNYLQ